jgi:hypothetical protein
MGHNLEIESMLIHPTKWGYRNNKNKMKIAGCIIQKRKILDNTLALFNANYKGKRIYITKDHGFGKPKYPQLSRFLIDVVDIKTGMYDVQTYQDFEHIDEAIEYALNGAMLVA